MASVLLLCLSFVKTDTRDEELAFVQYTECAPPLDAVDDALKCACMRWAKSNGGDDESEVRMPVHEDDCTADKMVRISPLSEYFEYST